MKLHDFRADFRKGRTGPGLRVRQDTQAYKASVREAQNMMVLSDARMERRWGTLMRVDLGEDARIEAWDYIAEDTSRFLLVFTSGALKIYDLTFTLRASFTGQPWTATTMRFMQIAVERNRMVLTDETFQTRILSYNPDAGSFAIATWFFDTSPDGSRLRAPFLQFVDDATVFTTTIYTRAGHSTGYASYIATAAGISAGSFDLALGTGTLTTNADYFTAGHVGLNLRLLEGEVTITAVTDARTAAITVKRDIAKRLDANPFYVRKGSKLVEVAWEGHGLSAGNTVFFVGLSDADTLPTLLTTAVKQASTSTAAPAPASTAAAYTIKRVIDDNHFEIEGAGTAATNDELMGGADVYAFVFSGIRRAEEPVFSAVRGWPQACAFHERRLWLGGSTSLPDSLFASTFSEIQNFDTGTGEDTDAIAGYGLGEQARVRHLVSAFDLQVFCDKGEFYVPGSRDAPITQSILRSVRTTQHGSAYTIPRLFDGGTYFVDAVGNHIREYRVENRDAEYVADAVTIVTPDWVRGPWDSTVYNGSSTKVTPYLMWVNGDDGSLLVMHSERSNDSFGFMRWTLDNGSFRSVVGLDRRLFAIAQRGSDFYLVEFDTSASPVTVDFGWIGEADPATTAWASPWHASETLQLQSGGRVFSDVTLDAGGAFTTPEALASVAVGDAMTWRVEIHAPVAPTGQGMKIGKNQRLVSTEINWSETETGFVEGQSALSSGDSALFGAPTPVDEWREYWIGKWGREPTLTISGTTPGRVGMRGLVLNVYV